MVGFENGLKSQEKTVLLITYNVCVIVEIKIKSIPGGDANIKKGCRIPDKMIVQQTITFRSKYHF